MKTCTGCKYMQRIDRTVNLASPYFCLRFPPTPHLVVQQDKFGSQTGTINIYPTINSETPACGEYQKDSALDS